MKKYTLFLLFNLAFAATLPAQDYESLVKEGAVWQIFSTGVEGTPMHYGYRLAGDTLIESQAYLKLYRLELFTDVPFPMPGQEEDLLVERQALVGALREDSLARKVWLRDFGNNPSHRTTCAAEQEQLVYDFNYELGDTVDVPCLVDYTDWAEELPCIVDSIYVEEVWGKPRRVVRCGQEAIWEDGYEYLVEGIGFKSGLLNFTIPGEVPVVGASLALHRYCAPDIAESCDLLTSTAAPPAQEGGLLLYPNPVQDVARLSWQGSAPFEARAVLRDAMGRAVLRAPLRMSAGQAELSVHGLPAGWYSLFVEAGGERRVARLVIAR